MLAERYSGLLLSGLLSMALCLGGPADALGAGSVSKKKYPVAGGGSLELLVPGDWVDKYRQPSPGQPPTILFSARDPREFMVIVTPITNDGNDPSFNSRARVRATVRGAAERAAPQAVESQLSIREVSGSSGSGFYYSATDRAPKPGEYAYLTQGAVAVEDLLVMFTVLTKDKAGARVFEALSMIETATRASD